MKEINENGIPYPECEIREWREGEFETWQKNLKH